MSFRGNQRHVNDTFRPSSHADFDSVPDNHSAGVRLHQRAPESPREVLDVVRVEPDDPLPQSVHHPHRGGGEGRVGLPERRVLRLRRGADELSVAERHVL